MPEMTDTERLQVLELMVRSADGDVGDRAAARVELRIEPGRTVRETVDELAASRRYAIRVSEERAEILAGNAW